MPEITSVAIGDHLVKTHPTIPMWNYIETTIASDLADNADYIRIFNLPAGYIVADVKTNISATLGSSCTLQARVGTTAVAAASTAGGADTKAAMTAQVAPSSSAQSFNYLVGGADISAGATLKTWVCLAPCQTVTQS